MSQYQQLLSQREAALNQHRLALHQQESRVWNHAPYLCNNHVCGDCVNGSMFLMRVSTVQAAEDIMYVDLVGTFCAKVTDGQALIQILI
jgi:hypothetical protein